MQSYGQRIETTDGASEAMRPTLRQQELEYIWSYDRKSIRIAYEITGSDGPAWLLLPALSTISTRQEWQLFSESIAERSGDMGSAPRLISVDWPGFGGSERRRLVTWTLESGPG